MRHTCVYCLACVALSAGCDSTSKPSPKPPATMVDGAPAVDGTDSGLSDSMLDPGMAREQVRPIFPLDLGSWHEGRPCGFTHEHELRYIRVLVDDAALGPYRELDAEHPYPVGATLVKLEYDDPECTELVGYTAMQKQAAGYSEVGSDWRWQRLTADREVLEDGELNTCIRCHEHHCTEGLCGYPRCGFDLTCAQEF